MGDHAGLPIATESLASPVDGPYDGDTVTWTHPLALLKHANLLDALHSIDYAVLVVHHVRGDGDAHRYSKAGQRSDLRSEGVDHLPVADNPDIHAALQGSLKSFRHGQRGEGVDGQVNGVLRPVDLLNDLAHISQGAVLVLAAEHHGFR